MILGQGGKRDIFLLFNPQVTPILTFNSGYDYFHVTKLFFQALLVGTGGSKVGSEAHQRESTFRISCAIYFLSLLISNLKFEWTRLVLLTYRTQHTHTHTM